MEERRTEKLVHEVTGMTEDTSSQIWNTGSALHQDFNVMAISDIFEMEATELESIMANFAKKFSTEGY